jgi:hypothetical protein
VTAPGGTGRRYEVVTTASTLTFDAQSTLHGVHGKADALSGFIQTDPSANGSISGPPPPKMHVEFPVESLKSGNAMQDREMYKLVDSQRFPRVTADLKELQPGSSPGTYTAAGDVALAGRGRRYSGDLTFAENGDTVTIEGSLNVDIRDFGLKPPTLLGIIKVEPVVAVHLVLVARRAG